MNILLLGGTRFLGPHLVEAARARGHTITLFNRGRSNPELFPQVERLYGDRDGDLAALVGRSWEAVIDTSGYVPRVVRASAELLAGSVAHYTFISSISVYDDLSQPGLSEASPLGILEDQTVEEVTGETYGPLKALCEAAVADIFPGRVLVVRPGLIVGPHDPTDRFTYWPWRIAKGGEVLAPGDPRTHTQFIDVRDLADWTVRMIEQGHSGVFNATGPATSLTMGGFLETCKTLSRTEVRLTWLEDTFLLEQQVVPWTELPLWLPGDQYPSGQSADIRRALGHGLAFRPLAETIIDTLGWATTRPGDHEWRAGMKPEREKSLLKRWHARKR